MCSMIRQYRDQITAIAKRRRELHNEIMRRPRAGLQRREFVLYLEQCELEWALRELCRSESGNIRF